MANRSIYPLLFALLSLSACTPLASFRFLKFERYYHLREAEELSRQGKYIEAIDEYREHIAARLTAENRPEWENPYFYYLIIGDILLGEERPDEAIIAYEFAEQNGVDALLISDRYRLVARWYEERGELEKAMAHLERYRDRDPLLFELTLDRMAKDLVHEEEGKKAAADTSLIEKIDAAEKPIEPPEPQNQSERPQ